MRHWKQDNMGFQMIDTRNLQLRNLIDKTAVDRLTLHVNDGEVFGFLGPNGAGRRAKGKTRRIFCCPNFNIDREQDRRLSGRE